MTFVEYELLTKRLLTLIADRSVVTTTRLEHNVQVGGLATTSQIDVLWEFTNAEANNRIVFECRHYNYSLKQSDVFAFSAVVGDLNAAPDSPPTTGVIVTKTGYQAGAQRVAETYGTSYFSCGNRL